MSNASNGGNSQAAKTQAPALIRSGRLREARIQLEERCRHCPEEADAWFLLGALNGRLGELDQAIEACEHTIAIRPDHADALYNLGQAHLHRGDIPRAAAAYESLVESHPDHALGWNNLGYILTRHPRWWRHHPRRYTGSLPCVNG